jgi:hypothetical protein
MEGGAIEKVEIWDLDDDPQPMGTLYVIFGGKLQ